VDTCFDLAAGLNYVKSDNLAPLGASIVKTFKLLSGMIGSNNVESMKRIDTGKI
jgi:hypothetical protein